ncbi:MAG: type II toxin-antitoxin system RelB/DinJ family antitoxin [Oscillospiraceae bacterium]|nr:type II toxin-antitoxin system RelB/DinJ family antitoxin [Oscillospiraceae bacterium]
MPETTNISIRMEKEVKEQAENLFSEFGMNITTAFNIFVREALRKRKFPCEISLPEDYNLDTIKTINDARRGIDIQKFTSTEEMFEELKRD